jgi:hypothetical protein
MELTEKNAWDPDFDSNLTGISEDAKSPPNQNFCAKNA